MVHAGRAVNVVGLIVISLAMLLVTAWGVLALLYFDHAPSALRYGLAALYAIASLVLVGGFILRRWRWRAFGAFAALFVLLLACWSAQSPSNDRVWQSENAVLTYATFDGDLVTVHNIRNFDYRTETDFTPAYYDRTFNLEQLDLGFDRRRQSCTSRQATCLATAPGFRTRTSSREASRRYRGRRW